jgi:hypothetical protein
VAHQPNESRIALTVRRASIPKLKWSCAGADTTPMSRNPSAVPSEIAHDPRPGEGDLLVGVPDRPARASEQTRRRTAARLVMSAVLLEMVMILPFVDHLADAHPTIHFTQHGFIFLGGVLIGIALRDVHRSSHP